MVIPMHRHRRFGFRTPRHRHTLKPSPLLLSLEPLETRNLLAVNLTALSPADDSVNVDIGENLVLTFGEAVLPGPGLGNIFIKDAAEDCLVEAINVNSDRARTARCTMAI